MKILVTGSAGFIGFHLIKRLLTEGHEVVGIDNINDYYDVNLKYGRLSELGIERKRVAKSRKVNSLLHERLTFYKAALEDTHFIERLFKKSNFEIVVNLAAQAGVRYSLENPQTYISANIQGFLNLLECCRKYPVRHLVYASSSSVYGLNKDEVFSTADRVDHPISIYAASKRSNELMAHVYSHLYGIPTTGLRFFTVYGPWGRPDMALFLFTKSILENKPISIYNHGKMERDFTYIDDIIEGIIHVISKVPVENAVPVDSDSNAVSSKAPFRIYNIGSNRPVSLIDFVKTLEVKLEKKAQKVFLPLQPGDVVTTYADVMPLIEDFGYKPSTQLHTGVERFVQWYRSFYAV